MASTVHQKARNYVNGNVCGGCNAIGDAQEPAIEAGGHRDGARGAGREVRDGGARVAVRRGPRGGHGGNVRNVFAAFLRGGVQAGEAFIHIALGGNRWSVFTVL